MRTGVGQTALHRSSVAMASYDFYSSVLRRNRAMHELGALYAAVMPSRAKDRVYDQVRDLGF